ncbi:MAG TPA: ABC transporter permease [Candidatus Dormibacteraeota bacterium]|nr:ABC transporter permease [Candidatus Dormibacteraeota bacterium]
MSWSDTWSFAMDALRANKLRSILTVLGVAIGSGCFVLVVTVALSGRKYIIHEIEAVGSNIVYAQLAQSNPMQAMVLSDQITMGDLRAVRESIPQVLRAAGTSDRQMSVVAAGKAWPVAMVGVTQGFEQIRRLIVTRGRYFDDADFTMVSKVCLLSQHLAETVFPGQDPVGQNIHVGELAFNVVGVFRERMDTFGQSEIRTDSVLVPFPLIQYYTGSSFIVTLYAQADRPQDVPLVTEDVARILKNRHRPEAEYNVQNLSSILETTRRISVAMMLVLLLIAILALVISGIGIMNIMLVSVTERTREIGIRKAIGARGMEIRYQFLLEAVLISVIGAVIGISAAVGIPFFIESLLRLLPVPPGITIPTSWPSVAVSFIFSCAIGVIFGYLPAKTAAALPPVESLRYE